MTPMSATSRVVGLGLSCVLLWLAGATVVAAQTVAPAEAPTTLNAVDFNFVGQANLGAPFQVDSGRSASNAAPLPETACDGWWNDLQQSETLRANLMRLCAIYLTQPARRPETGLIRRRAFILAMARGSNVSTCSAIPCRVGSRNSSVSLSTTSTTKTASRPPRGLRA
jgi:hypothetical protein